MIRIVMILFLGMMVCIGADDAEFRGEAKAKIEILQKQNDELKTKVDALDDKTKSVDVYKEQIQEVNTHVDRTINILAIILALSGFLGYFSVKARAKVEARETAEEWFKNNSEDLKQQIKELTVLKDQAEAKTEEHNNYLEKSKEEIEKIKKNIFSSDPKLKKVEVYTNVESAISNVAEHIRQTKPQSEYSFDDWDTLAFDFLAHNKYEDAIYHWNKAIELGNPTDVEHAQTLYSIGFSLDKIKESQKAINVYDKLLAYFKGKQSLVIEEIIANAFVSKGFTLSKMEGTHEEEINVYDMLFRRFSGKQPLVIEEPIVKALYNKGVTLGQMGEYQKAAGVYEELFTRFKGIHSAIIEENIAQALINLFELQIISSKPFDENKVEYFRQTVTINQQDLLHFEALQIIRDALLSDQSAKIQKVKENFANIEFGDWSWKDLENWVDSLLDSDAKERILNTIGVFKNWTVISNEVNG